MLEHSDMQSLWRRVGGGVRVVLVMLFVFSRASTAHAQNAQITGVAKDQSGGVMPAVTMTAKNLATGLTRSQVTDGTGNFRLVALPPGTSTITADIQTFNTETRPTTILTTSATSPIHFTPNPPNVAQQ